MCIRTMTLCLAAFIAACAGNGGPRDRVPRERHIESTHAEAFPYDAVRDRLLRETSGRGVMVTTPECVANQPLPVLTDPAFASSHPDGVWLVCGAARAGSTAKVTLFRYLFHTASSRVRAASRIDVTLAKWDARWRVVEWKEATFDYAL
jgi:hypothetical protein